MEAVLLLLVVVIIAVKISSIAKEQGFMRNVVEGPWQPIRGMIEDGVWMKYTNSKPLHPNQFNRRQTRKGDTT